MSSAASALDRFRLPTIFHAASGSITHPVAAKPTFAQRGGGVWRHDTELGTGSFASVRREKNERSGEVRAVKLVSKASLKTCSIDYKHELGVLVAVRDRAEFVSFIGWFEDPEYVYFAMEFAEHGDLERFMTDHPARATAAVRDIARQILQGICILHERQICHRDIKPKNILIASLAPLRLKIADFGLSTQDPSSPLPYGCGTKRYQAPEQLRFLHAPCLPHPRARFPFAADVWAVGVIVFTIVAGTNPFFGPKEAEREADMNGSWGITTPNLLALQRYCDGGGLRTVEMRAAGVGERGVRFVEGLLRPDPGARVRAEVAVRDAWLGGRAGSVGSQVRMAMGMGAGFGMMQRGA